MKYNKTPSISVVIVTYNGLEWIDLCLSSLFESSIVLHVIVIDNGSTDGTVEKIKADFKSLGKRLGAKMKKAASIIENFSQDDIASLEKNGLFKIDIDEEIIEITPADVIITAEDVPGWSVAGKGNLTVALDITISEALKQEGIARMFVNRVQNIRKEHKFELTDRIFVEIQDNEAIKSAIDSFYDYISSEILADELLLVKDLKNGTDIDINDTILKISVKKNS